MSIKEKKKRFSIIFDLNYPQLVGIAFSMVKDRDIEEELVQECFVKTWINFEKIRGDDKAVGAYLRTTLKNNIVDHFRKKQISSKHKEIFSLDSKIETEVSEAWDLSRRIHSVYSTLPKTTQDIFKLSREEGLSYKEISIKLNISVKTVESHISNALKVILQQNLV